ncbi:MAG: cache domain-containing protein [Planctomycetota bacterium]
MHRNRRIQRVLLTGLAVLALAGGACRRDRPVEDPNQLSESNQTYNPPIVHPSDANVRTDGNTVSSPKLDHRPIPAAQLARLHALKEKVVRAAHYLAEHGRDALGEFGDPNSRWGREPYVFVWTIQGVCIAHPNNRNLVGRNLMGLTDTQGDNFAIKFARIATDKANAYQGWCDYYWNPPGSDESTQKVSFIKRVSGRTWLVGAGLYADLSADRVRHAMRDPNAMVTP